MSAKFLGKSLECFLNGYLTVYDSVNSVGSFSETIVVQYTIPGGQTFTVVGGSATGMTDTVFKLYINDILKETKRNAWTKRNINFDVMGNASAGQIVKITCEHGSSTPHDFEASIFGILS